MAFVLGYLARSARQRNVRFVIVLIVVFVLVVIGYTVGFHALMDAEGQSHSWATGVYWTLVTMTTLGFGDITFTSDAGRIFSVVVLLSGTIFLLVLLPFTFIQFVFVPWMDRRESARAPRQLPESTSGHLVLTSLGPIEDALIRRARRAGVPYVLMVDDLEAALQLHDRGYRVVVGSLDDPEAYRSCRVGQAALVAATGSDTANTNITFTVREISRTVPVAAIASKAASIDILELAGADLVLQLGEILGRAMAARTLAPDGLSHVIGEFAGLQIAEARASSTTLVGRTLAEARLRSRLGVGVIGVWDHGDFEIAEPSTPIRETSVLILAATRDELDAYDRCYSTGVAGTESVVIIGGGRVGRAAGRAMSESGTDFRIVEQQASRLRNRDHYVMGDAADLAVLEAAGIRDASSVIITTHDDDVNIYLAIYCRRLRPDIEVVARANVDRNVSTLYRAGANDVLSYASTGAAAVWNQFRHDDTLVVAEGLSVFRVAVPPSLAGTTLADSGIRAMTGCNLVALAHDGGVDANPSGDTVLDRAAELVLIGDDDAEARFAACHPPTRRRLRPTR